MGRVQGAPRRVRDRHVMKTELMWVLLEERKEMGEGKGERGGRERKREHGVASHGKRRGK